MTNEEVAQDLKQFIVATVSQTVTQIVTQVVSQAVSQAEDRINANLHRVETRLNQRIFDLDAKIDTIHDAIAETFSGAGESTDVTLQDHEQRLCRLETGASQATPF